MPTKTKADPSYRLHKPSGRALVTLTCRNTGRRRDVYLGEYGTDDSREKYNRVLDGWKDDGRVLDARAAAIADPQDRVLTVTDLVVQYIDLYAIPRWGGTGKNKDKAPHGVKTTMGIVRSLYGRDPVHRFGPKALKTVREEMIDREWVRTTINQRIPHLVSVFGWGVAEEIVPVQTWQALQAVKPLKRGEGAREGKRVLPVPEAYINAIRDRVSPTVWSLIQLQLFTGARAGELVNLRLCDIDTAGEVWQADLTHHKTEHHGHDRVIMFGPKAKEVLNPLLAGRKTTDNVFDAGRGKGAYDTASYRRSITRACEAAGVPVWTPHRLRHNAATNLRREFGLEAAKLVLGHSCGRMTELYAEADKAKTADVIARVG